MYSRRLFVVKMRVSVIIYLGFSNPFELFFISSAFLSLISAPRERQPGWRGAGGAACQIITPRLAIVDGSREIE